MKGEVTARFRAVSFLYISEFSCLLKTRIDLNTSGNDCVNKLSSGKEKTAKKKELDVVNNYVGPALWHFNCRSTYEFFLTNIIKQTLCNQTVYYQWH
jgi:hypothetical protein